jgi:2-dehydro-3-deoxyphosphogluconate aldolase/(4S)-4-hydroxy-2-oxoglutarate aldolase
MDVGELLKRERIVPVVVIDDAAKAVPLARTLMEAGLNSIEVTLRSAAALAAIEQIATKVPGLIVGAGSLRRSEQVSDIVCGRARLGARPARRGRGGRVAAAARRCDRGRDDATF